MKSAFAAFQPRFNAWLLRVGKLRVVLAITAVSSVLSVLMTWVGNAVFMPDVPVEEWLYISLIVPVLISPVISSMVLSLLYQLAEAKAALVVMSETDALTGVGNRRHLVTSADRAMADATRRQEPLSLVLIDIDHFKRLNDSYGHAVGDEALVTVAHICRDALRAGDVFCRWGGEEFIALLPTATLEMGCALAERLRARVAAARIAAVPNGVTISLGVAQLDDGDTLDELVARADFHLYAAKEAGRNRVEPGMDTDAAIARFREADEDQPEAVRAMGRVSRYAGR